MFYTPTQYFVITLIIGLLIIIYKLDKKIKKLKNIIRNKYIINKVNLVKLKESLNENTCPELEIIKTTKEDKDYSEQDFEPFNTDEHLPNKELTNDLKDLHYKAMGIDPKTITDSAEINSAECFSGIMAEEMHLVNMKSNESKTIAFMWKGKEITL